MYQMDNKTCANVVKYPSLTDFVSFVQACGTNSDQYFNRKVG